MTRLPVVRFKQLDKALQRFGFQPVRHHGGHVFYRHPDGRVTTVPNHPGRDIARPLLRAILREINVSPEELRDTLERL